MCKPTSATPDYTMASARSSWSPSGNTRRSKCRISDPVSQARPSHSRLWLWAGHHIRGLAKAVAPGELHGVDMEQSQVDLARAVATFRDQPNAVFHVGDVTNLDFEDGFFDIAHCHNVLMHVPDTAAVLAEVKRVLKPGGIIGCREMICESSFTHPDFGVLRKAWDMFEDLLAADDGHPQMGKDLKRHIVEAGFANPLTTATFDRLQRARGRSLHLRVANKWFLSPEIVEAAIKYGASTQELCDAIRDAYDRWKDHPGAFAALAFGEVVANKPQL